MKFREEFERSKKISYDVVEEVKFDYKKYSEDEYAKENNKWLERLDEDLNYFKTIDEKPKTKKGKPYTVTKELDKMELKYKQMKKTSKTPTKSKTQPQVQMKGEEPKEDKVSYNEVRGLTEELEVVKRLFKELKKQTEENCIMYNEKRQFEKLKSDFIKLNADNNIMRQEMAEVTGEVSELIKRVQFLEEENRYLRKMNKNYGKYFAEENDNFGKEKDEERLDNRMQMGFNTSTVEMNNIISNDRKRYYLIPKTDFQ